MIGPVCVSTHNQLCEVTCEIVQETGARARREVFVPEFVQNVYTNPTDDEPRRKAAILDVWGFGARWVPDLLADITVRHPAAERYRQKAEEQQGAAAQMAEEDKQARYPPAAGRRVRTIAFETWGRLGEEGEAVLTSLAAAASERDRWSGRTGRGRLTQWRARLDAVLQAGVARALESSRLGLPGHPPQQRSHPADGLR